MGNFITFARDTLVNLVSGLGTDRDKRAGSVYAVPPLDDEQLISAYRSSWLPKKIVDIPAMDAVRKWRDWQADSDTIEKIEEEEKRLDLRGKVMSALIKARLLGGAAIYIGTGDARPEEEFDPERISAEGIKHLNVLTRRELSAGEIELDPESEWYARPKWYELANNTSQMVRIHPSRLVIFKGSEPPVDELGTYQGWGDSVLMATTDAIKNADGTAGNIAAMTFEAIVDIIKVPNLMSQVADPEYRSRFMERYQLFGMGKSTTRLGILDSEEEYERKQMSFATLPEVMQTFLQIVSGAADIPVTRLLGQSPAGMSATGESDLRNYYDRISAMQELEITPAMKRLDEALICSATGTREPEVHYIWSSLWQISDKERAEIGKLDAETIEKLDMTGLFPREALAKAGANMLVEHSIMPGLQEAIDEAGGLPDYDMERQREEEAEAARMEALRQAQEANPDAAV